MNVIAPYLVYLSAVIYAGAAGGYLYEGNWRMSVAFTCWAIANVALASAQ